MFTGIIEEKGVILSVSKQTKSLKLTIEAHMILSDMKIGDSISINGVCLTVTSFMEKQFTVDVMPETFRLSSLSQTKVGDFVNLERAIQANGRFGGHFVSGHVDTVGEVKQVWQEENARYLKIQMNKTQTNYLMPKGSVTVDGTSLTIFHVGSSYFVISLIPETQQATILGEKQQGDIVNIEYDMLAKYMDHLLVHRTGKDQSTNVTDILLKEHGFMD